MLQPHSLSLVAFPKGLAQPDLFYLNLISFDLDFFSCSERIIIIIIPNILIFVLITDLKKKNLSLLSVTVDHYELDNIGADFQIIVLLEVS